MAARQQWTRLHNRWATLTFAACPLSKVMRTCAPQLRVAVATRGISYYRLTSEIGMKMDETELDPHPLPRNVTLALLLALAAAAWAVLVWHHHDVNMDRASPTMGLRAPLFLAIWVIMMVAMMFPTAAPMILTFHKVQAGKRQRGDAFVSTWVFVAAYFWCGRWRGLPPMPARLLPRPLPCAPRYRRPPRPVSAAQSSCWRVSISSRP